MEPLWLLVVLLALGGLSILAYAVRALDLLGAVASFFLGLEVALLGGLGWLAVMTAFPAMSIVATRIGAATKRELRVEEARGGERGAPNVLANGLAAGLAALAVPLAPLVPPEAALLAFVTAVAAVTADTLASELGALARTAHRILPPFQAAQPGTNGAVSWLGQSAALAGSVAIAAVATLVVDLPVGLAWVPVLGGFLGCQLDSLLGATLEQDVHQDGPLSKQDVNFLASALPAFLVLVVASLVIR